MGTITNEQHAAILALRRTIEINVTAPHLDAASDMAHQLAFDAGIQPDSDNQGMIITLIELLGIIEPEMVARLTIDQR